MSYLEGVKKGRLKTPTRLLVYGVEGVGKSTLGSEAPNPIFVGKESGTEQLDVARLEPTTFQEFVDVLKELRDSNHSYQSLVIESLDWIEPLVWKQVLSEDPKHPSDISKIGYNKGYEAATMKTRELIDLIESVRSKRNMNVILVAHSKIKKFDDPSTTNGYDRYILAIREDVGSIYRQYVDAILFLNYEVVVKEDDKRGYGNGLRFMFTEERPSFHAKNRYGLPFKMPYVKGEGWKCLMDAIESGNPEASDVLLRGIEEMLGRITDKELLPKVKESISKANGDAKKLLPIRDKLLTLTGGIK
jgi:hypothetical protein